MGARCAMEQRLSTSLSLSVTASTAMRPPGRRPTTAPKIDDCHLRHSKIAIPVNGHFGFVVRCRRHAQGAPGRQGEQVHLHAQLLTAIVIRYLLANPGTGSDSRGQREIYGFENFHFRLFPFADPSWREQSFSRNGLPSRNGGVEVCFSTRGRESAARAGSHSTHSAVRCRRQQRRLKDHFLPASLPRPRASTRPVVPLFHPYHTLNSPTFTLPVGSPPRLPSLQLFSFPSLLPRSESETSSLFPKFPPLPFHSVALSFRGVCCTSLQCPSRTAVSPPSPLLLH